MKNKETMIEEVKDVNEVVEQEEVVESKGFLTKVRGAVKKHGKKVVTGVAIGAVGLIGYALGKGLKGSDDSEENDWVDEANDLLVEDCSEVPAE